MNLYLDMHLILPPLIRLCILFVKFERKMFLFFFYANIFVCKYSCYTYLPIVYISCLRSISVRGCLGLSVVYSLNKFQQQIGKQFGRDVAKYLVFITISQFHLMFYISRPLPNIFALAVGKSSINYF